MMPAQAFDTPTKRKVLRVMAEDNRKLTASELANACHRSKSSISRALSDLTAFPFVARQGVPESKQRIYGFDRESGYTTPILRFFEIERERERRSGTVPVDVWNLLEDVAREMHSNVDTFVEVFLFGSYATGNYYTGSDIDVFLVVEPPREVGKHQGQRVLDALGSEWDIHLLVGEAAEPEDGWDDAAIGDAARKRAPVDVGEPMIALHGDVR